MMEGFDLVKILMADSKTSEVGVYNLTPIEVFVINQFLPYGTKLELEDRLLKSSSLSNRGSSNIDWAKRLRRTTLKRKNKKKLLKKLVYQGKPNINPNVLLYMKCYLVLNSLFSCKNAELFKAHQISSVPTLSNIEKRLKEKQFFSFFDFKKALRQIWLYYYINYEGNKEVIYNASIMSKLTEECFDEVEEMNEKKIEEKIMGKKLLSSVLQTTYNPQLPVSASNSNSNISSMMVNNNLSEIYDKNKSAHPKNPFKTSIITSTTPNHLNTNHSINTNLPGNATNQQTMPRISGPKPQNFPFFVTNKVTTPVPKNTNTNMRNPVLTPGNYPSVNTTQHRNIPPPMNTINNNIMMTNPMTNNLNTSMTNNINNNITTNLTNNISPQTQEITMTNDEKSILFDKIHSLTDKQLKGIVKVISEYFTDTSPDSKYFECDIYNLNNSQLRKLEKYVNDCIKENHLINMAVTQNQALQQNHSMNVNYLNDDTESIQLNQLKPELTNTPKRAYYANSSPIENPYQYQNVPYGYHPINNVNNSLLDKSNNMRNTNNLTTNNSQIWNTGGLNISTTTNERNNLNNPNPEQENPSDSDSFDYH